MARQTKLIVALCAFSSISSLAHAQTYMARERIVVGSSAAPTPAPTPTPTPTPTPLAWPCDITNPLCTQPDAPEVAPEKPTDQETAEHIIAVGRAVDAATMRVYNLTGTISTSVAQTVPLGINAVPTLIAPVTLEDNLPVKAVGRRAPVVRIGPLTDALCERINEIIGVPTDYYETTHEESCYTAYLGDKWYERKLYAQSADQILSAGAQVAIAANLRYEATGAPASGAVSAFAPLYMPALPKLPPQAVADTSAYAVDITGQLMQPIVYAVRGISQETCREINDKLGQGQKIDVYYIGYLETCYYQNQANDYIYVKTLLLQDPDRIIAAGAAINLGAEAKYRQTGVYPINITQIEPVLAGGKRPYPSGGLSADEVFSTIGDSSRDDIYAIGRISQPTCEAINVKLGLGAGYSYRGDAIREACFWHNNRGELVYYKRLRKQDADTIIAKGHEILVAAQAWNVANGGCVPGSTIPGLPCAWPSDYSVLLSGYNVQTLNPLTGGLVAYTRAPNYWDATFAIPGIDSATCAEINAKTGGAQGSIAAPEGCSYHANEGKQFYYIRLTQSLIGQSGSAPTPAQTTTSYAAVNWTLPSYSSTCSLTAIMTRSADCQKTIKDGANIISQTIVGGSECAASGVAVSETTTVVNQTTCPLPPGPPADMGPQFMWGWSASQARKAFTNEGGVYNTPIGSQAGVNLSGTNTLVVNGKSYALTNDSCTFPGGAYACAEPHALTFYWTWKGSQRIVVTSDGKQLNAGISRQFELYDNGTMKYNGKIYWPS